MALYINSLHRPSLLIRKQQDEEEEEEGNNRINTSKMSMLFVSRLVKRFHNSSITDHNNNTMMSESERSHSEVAEQAKKRYKVDAERTHFPDLSIPEAELTEISDEENDEVKLERRQREDEKFADKSKEDADVAMFLACADRMSLKSLMFLLQGQARAQNLPEQYLQQYTPLVQKKVEDEEEKSREHTQTAQGEIKKATPIKKQFRFAEMSGGKSVLVRKHYVDSYKSLPNLWWAPEEVHAIRLDAVETVRYYKQRRPDYRQWIEIVANNVENPQTIDSNLKNIANDSYARGLESHIVSMLSDVRKSTVMAVLEEQDDCRNACDGYDETAHCLREQSLAYSKMSAQFARKIGDCDCANAMKASISKWRRQVPEESSRSPKPQSEFWG